MPNGARACKRMYSKRSPAGGLDANASKIAYPAELEGFNYFCTITIKPQYNHLTLRQQYRKSVNQALQVIKTNSNDYRMAVEISPKNAQIHYHGILKINPSNFDNDQIRWLFIDFARSQPALGFVQIDLIESIGKSYEYITCELVKTNAVLNRDESKVKYPVYLKPSDAEISFQPKPLIKKKVVEDCLDKDVIVQEKPIYPEILTKLDLSYQHFNQKWSHHLKEVEDELNIFKFLNCFLKKKISSNDI